MEGVRHSWHGPHTETTAVKRLKHKGESEANVSYILGLSEINLKVIYFTVPLTKKGKDKGLEMSQCLPRAWKMRGSEGLSRATRELSGT